jgi:hypothetical protein
MPDGKPAGSSTVLIENDVVRVTEWRIELRGLGTLFPVAVPVVVDGALWGPFLWARAGRSRRRLTSKAVSRSSRSSSPPRSRMPKAAPSSPPLRLAPASSAGNRLPSPSRDVGRARRESRRAVLSRRRGGRRHHRHSLVGVHRYEADGTHTVLGIFGETSFTVGRRWPVEDGGDRRNDPRHRSPLAEGRRDALDGRRTDRRRGQRLGFPGRRLEARQAHPRRHGGAASARPP